MTPSKAAFRSSTFFCLIPPEGAYFFFRMGFEKERNSIWWFAFLQQQRHLPTVCRHSAANFAFLAADGQVSHSAPPRLADCRMSGLAPGRRCPTLAESGADPLLPFRRQVLTPRCKPSALLAGRDQLQAFDLQPTSVNFRKKGAVATAKIPSPHSTTIACKLGYVVSDVLSPRRSRA